MTTGRFTAHPPDLKAEALQLRAWIAGRDHALAQEAALATAWPFPDRILPGQGCNCAFGPRCESNRCCADEDQAIGNRDMRTGEIRKRAAWSIVHPWWTRGPVPRVLFYCDDCLQELKAVWGAPIRGITQPAHASEFWQPSIADHARLTMQRSAGRS